MGELKVNAFLDSKDADAMAAQAGTFDFILDTVSAQHDIGQLLGMLKTDGKLILVGVPPEGIAVSAFAFIGGRKTLSGSLIGGVKECQEMLDFCGTHNITCEIELVDASKINEAYERTITGDVKYRFVIDTATF